MAKPKTSNKESSRKVERKTERKGALYESELVNDPDLATKYPAIYEYYAGPFTRNPIILPEEQEAAESDREMARSLKFDEQYVEGYVKSRIIERRLEQHRRQRIFSEIASKADAARPSTPEWDADRGELKFGGAIVRHVKRNAVNIRLVLDSFQELGWPIRIDDPAAGGKNQSRVNGTVKRMNQELTKIRFHADGSGAGYSWSQADK
jgi:hypothetical protein